MLYVLNWAARFSIDKDDKPAAGRNTARLFFQQSSRALAGESKRR
jgi:hypothetical protein